MVRKGPSTGHSSDVRDPLEGVAADGTITTGVDIARVTDPFRPVLEAAVEAVRSSTPAASLYVYGSVATGRARVGFSDVDLLAVDAGPAVVERLSADLTARYTDRCRAVEIASGSVDSLIGDDDEAYGNRVFLHHYCAHLLGPDHDRARSGFPADARAARGFNGDIDAHARRWRRAAGVATQPAELSGLARRIARKVLLAVAGLVSVHDGTWTTDRESAAGRWAEIDPRRAAVLERLAVWTTDPPSAIDRATLTAVIDDTVMPIVDRFDKMIGLWRRPPRAP